MGYFGHDELRRALRQGPEWPIGSIAAIPNGEHFVYYLVIRGNWWDRGAYRPLREALQAMREHAEENSVSKIAMGRLGCHDCGLEFNEVRKEIDSVFAGSDIELHANSMRTYK